MIDRDNFYDLCEEFGLPFWEGCDDAVIGIASRCGDDPLVVYDRDKLVKNFMKKDGMTFEEAEEWVSYNIEGSFIGEGTPLIFERIEDVKK